MKKNKKKKQNMLKAISFHFLLVDTRFLLRGLTNAIYMISFLVLNYIISPKKKKN